MKKIEFNGNKNVVFGRLKAERERMGLSQAELAAKMQVLNVNIDQQMISRIERNKRIVTDYELACFCKILNITEQSLLSDFHNNPVV